MEHPRAQAGYHMQLAGNSHGFRMPAVIGCMSPHDGGKDMRSLKKKPRQRLSSARALRSELATDYTFTAGWVA
jgi:hypothetical protein